MEFSKVVGNIDPGLVKKAELALTKVFLSFASNPDPKKGIADGLGGDPLVFTLMAPLEHICTTSVATAATDGKRFYWNPKFVTRLHHYGLRFVCQHEAWHSLYMHPNRVKRRNPRLWNIAVDYIVNGVIFEDLEVRIPNSENFRGKNSKDTFSEHLGKYITLEEYVEMIKDPTKNKYKDLLDNSTDSNEKLPNPTEDRPLTDLEKKALEKREKKISRFYADPSIPEEMRSPEKIYAYLYDLIPKCPDCGKLGMYTKPKKEKNKSGKPEKGGKDKVKDKSGDKKSDQGEPQENDEGESGEGEPGGDDGESDSGEGEGCGHGKKPSPKGKGKGQESGDGSGQGEEQGENGNEEGEGESGESKGDSCCGGCGTCGDGIDVLGLGDTVDDHISSEETEEKLAKRIADAMEFARKMAGTVPGALEDELGKLLAPKMTWKDEIRRLVKKTTQGNAKNDWTSPRSRPLFSGLYIPKRKGYQVRFGCCLDTSGSMGIDDMAFGISQLASLDSGAEGSVTPTDCQVYWEATTKIKNAKADELCKVKVVGRGGTSLFSYVNEYTTHPEVGKCDFIIMITDGYLGGDEFNAMKDPGVPVYWLITSNHDGFTVPFGKIFMLRDI
jgi:predicted metal-dependent peptidase